MDGFLLEVRLGLNRKLFILFFRYFKFLKVHLRWKNLKYTRYNNFFCTFYKPNTFNQGMLVSERQIFLNSIISIWNNSSGSNSSDNMENLEMRLTEYEQVVEQAVDNGINIVTQDMVVNWDYIQVMSKKT